MIERGKGGRGRFPLLIDFEGGVLRPKSERGRPISFGMRNDDDGQAKLIWEGDGGDSRTSLTMSSGSRVEVQAKAESLIVSQTRPLMIFSFLRSDGSLRELIASGIDLIGVAGLKLPLMEIDLRKIDKLALGGVDSLFAMTFTPGGVVVTTLETAKGQLVSAKQELLKELNHPVWSGDFGLVQTRLGFEVFSNRVVIFGKNTARSVRQDILSVPRTVSGGIFFDRKAAFELPSQKELYEFIGGIYSPLII